MKKLFSLFCFVFFVFAVSNISAAPPDDVGVSKIEIVKQQANNVAVSIVTDVAIVNKFFISNAEPIKEVYFYKKEIVTNFNAIQTVSEHIKPPDKTNNLINNKPYILYLKNFSPYWICNYI